MNTKFNTEAVKVPLAHDRLLGIQSSFQYAWQERYLQAFLEMPWTQSQMLKTRKLAKING